MYVVVVMDNAKKFKAKLNTNIFRLKTFILFMVYLLQKLCLYLIF